MLAEIKRAWKGGMPAARQGRIKPPWLWEPLSRRDLAAWVMLRPRSVLAVPCSGEPRDAPGCRSSPVRGMLPLVHPFPAKSRPPSARDTPGTATLPGNSCCCRRRARGIPTANVPGRQVWAAPAACVLRWVPAMGWVPSRARAAAGDGAGSDACLPLGRRVWPGGLEWAASPRHPLPSPPGRRDGPASDDGSRGYFYNRAGKFLPCFFFFSPLLFPSLQIKKAPRRG